MITLYGSGQSRSFRVLWALEESGLVYDYKQVKIGQTGDDGTQNDTYKKLNSQGKVPTLVDGNLVISESAAILNYIATISPNKNLIPFNNNELRAQYDAVSFFVLSELEQPLWTMAKHRFVLPKEFRLREIKKTAEWEFAKVVSTLSERLNNKEFAINNSFTMADILIAYTLQWAQRSKFDIPDNLVTYCENLYQRSACLGSTGICGI